MQNIKTALICVFVQLCVFVGTVTAAGTEPHQYSFGVVPQFEQRKLYAIWKPIVDELEKRTGLSFRLVTTLKIRDFEQEYQQGKFDFAYMNPYYVIRGVTPGTYIPLVRDNRSLHGILVVRKDGPIRKIADLEGRTVAFPSPNALGASLLMRADLERTFGVKVVPLYVKTHSSVYLHVAKDLASAGGGVQKSLQEQDAAVRDLLTVLYTSRPMPSHPVSAHQSVPPAVREKVRYALLEMGRTEAGRALFAKIPAREMVAASLDDYLVMESWGLDRYWDAGWAEE